MASAQEPPPRDLYAEARNLIAAARSASLATVSDGAPFAALVTPAFMPDGAAILLLSQLSSHTRHLQANPACALLLVGEPATFRFFSSTARRHDAPGDLIPHWDEGELQETDSLEAHLPRPEKVEEDYVPVKFHSKISELGVFELWCVSTQSEQRWKLEFSVREDADG